MGVRVERNEGGNFASSCNNTKEWGRDMEKGRETVEEEGTRDGRGREMEAGGAAIEPSNKHLRSYSHGYGVCVNTGEER